MRGPDAWQYFLIWYSVGIVLALGLIALNWR